MRRGAALLSIASVVLLAALSPVWAAAAAEAKPGISHEALYLMKRVGAPAKRRIGPIGLDEYRPQGLKGRQ